MIKLLKINQKIGGIMINGNAILEELLVYASQYNLRISNDYKVLGSRVRITDMNLNDYDWSTLETYLATSKESLNLVFVVMLYHFPENFSRDNLKIFISSGSLKVKNIAEDILIIMSDNDKWYENKTVLEDLFHKLTGERIKSLVQ